MCGPPCRAQLGGVLFLLRPALPFSPGPAHHLQPREACVPRIPAGPGHGRALRSRFRPREPFSWKCHAMRPLSYAAPPHPLTPSEAPPRICRCGLLRSRKPRPPPHHLLSADTKAALATNKAPPSLCPPPRPPAQVFILPTIRINNAQYRGKLAVTEVLRAICAGFLEGNRPAACDRVRAAREGRGRLCLLPCQESSSWRRLVLHTSGFQWQQQQEASEQKKVNLALTPCQPHTFFHPPSCPRTLRR